MIKAKPFKWVFPILILFTITSLYGQTFTETDQYGREVVNAQGAHINYTFEETRNLIPVDQLAQNHLKQLRSGNASAESVKDTAYFDVQNRYTIAGTSIGRNSMHSRDVNGDGTMDLICTASSGSYGKGNFWYVLNYHPIDESYITLWSSQEYEYDINVLEVAKIATDSAYYIYLGLSNGTVEMYDPDDFSLISSVRLAGALDIVYADANSDGAGELVVPTGSKTYLLDPGTLEILSTVSAGADYVRVGNVDGAIGNELVFSSGQVYSHQAGSWNEIWTFDENYSGLIELSDIDSDGIDEIIFAESWYNIHVYDVDEKATKYTYRADLDINTLYVSDVDKDGTDEIIFGDGQWGKVHCLDAVSQSEIWKVDNPEHGVAAINLADLDDDGLDELIWTAGWTSTGEDFLYVYDLENKKISWQSVDIVGPFYAVAIGDVDADGNQDLVTISYESESGYGSGVLIVMDPETGKIKWVSSGDLFDNVWSGIYDLAIADVDNDGQNEIVVAAGVTYTGTIWVVDAKLKVVESSYTFPWSEDVSEFYALEVTDMDNDGQLEVVAVNREKVFVMNPADWSTEWMVTLSGTNYIKPDLLCTDFDRDGHKEVVVCRGAIEMLNADHETIWMTSATNFTSIDTVDYNRDGVLDILATTSGGKLQIYDGSSQEELADLQVETSGIESALVLAMEDTLLYVYSCDGRINFYINDEQRMVSQYLSPGPGKMEGLKHFHFNNEPNFLVGTGISLLSLSGKVLECIRFGLSTETKDASCKDDDGQITVFANGGLAPYQFDWNTLETGDFLSGLAPGNYTVKVTDQSGCTKEQFIRVNRAKITATLTTVNEGCKIPGSAQIVISEGTAPFDTRWSTGSNENIIGDLTAGTYKVEVTDAQGCFFTDSIAVNKDSLLLSPLIHHANCHGDQDGYIHLHVVSGSIPVNFQWNNGATDDLLNDLGAGIYQVTATDAGGCETTLSIELTEPDAISYDLLTTPDDPSTTNWEGKIMVRDISGGTSPYQVYWPSLYQYNSYLEILPAGDYPFSIIDANNCRVYDTASVSVYNDILASQSGMELSVYPNPFKDEIQVNEKLGLDVIERVEISSVSGEIITPRKWESSQSSLNLSELESGVYLLRFITFNGRSVVQVVIKE
jgi:hypothetical protein